MKRHIIDLLSATARPITVHHRTESNIHQQIIVGVFAALLIPTLASAEDNALDKEMPRIIYPEGELIVKYSDTSPFQKEAVEIARAGSEWNETLKDFKTKLKKHFEEDSEFRPLNVSWKGPYIDDESIDINVGSDWKGVDDPSIAISYGKTMLDQSENVKHLDRYFSALKTAGKLENMTVHTWHVRITLAKNSDLATEWEAIQKNYRKFHQTREHLYSQIKKSIHEESSVEVTMVFKTRDFRFDFDPKDQPAMEKYFQTQKDKNVIESFDKVGVSIGRVEKDYIPGSIQLEYADNSTVQKEAAEIVQAGSEWNQTLKDFKAKLKKHFEEDSEFRPLKVSWKGMFFDDEFIEVNEDSGWKGPDDPSIAISYGEPEQAERKNVEQLKSYFSTLKTAGKLENMTVREQDIRITLAKDSEFTAEWEAIQKNYRKLQQDRDDLVSQLEKSIYQESKIKARVVFHNPVFGVTFDEWDQEAMEKYFQSQKEKKVIEYFIREGFGTLHWTEPQPGQGQP